MKFGEKLKKTVTDNKDRLREIRRQNHQKQVKGMSDDMLAKAAEGAVSAQYRTDEVLSETIDFFTAEGLDVYVARNTITFKWG